MQADAARDFIGVAAGSLDGEAGGGGSGGPGEEWVPDSEYWGERKWKWVDVMVKERKE